MLPCLNKQLFGIDCFGCGLQRSLALIFKGEFIAAFKMYPAIYLLLSLGLFIIVNYFVKFKNGFKITQWLAITSVITIIASYFIKLIN